MEERYHTTTQNRFYPDMSNVNKNITVEAKLISPPTYIYFHRLFVCTNRWLLWANFPFILPTVWIRRSDNLAPLFIFLIVLFLFNYLFIYYCYISQDA